jgi:DNA-binding HxlR family transcriptional regulator
MKKQAKSSITGCGSRSPCPITNTLDLIGDKWTLLIIRDMIFLKKNQFSEFENSGEGISTNILADRLKKLEEYGVITKNAYQKKPTRYKYMPTRIGEALFPLLMEMVKWGGEYIEEAYTPTKEDIEKVRAKVRDNKTI